MPEKLAWLFLLSGPDCNQIGIYRTSISEIARGIGARPAEAERLMAKLSDVGMVRWDASTDLVWVTNWLKYNLPDGPKQWKGYLNALDEFRPHPFARTLSMMLWPVGIGMPGQPAELNKKQAIVIRDGCRCSYCGNALVEWSDIEIDHVVPKSKRDQNGKYEDLVCACKSCNQEKGDRDAEEFGYPFVTGRPYSVGLAAHRLVFEPSIRRQFSCIAKGLPGQLKGIDELEQLLTSAGYWNEEAEGNPSDTVSVGYRLQDQDQDQDQEQEQEEEYCAEPAVAAPALVTFPCSGKPDVWDMTEEHRSEWAAAYPGVDVLGEARKALAWIHANPTKSKTARGMAKFLLGWMGRAQNSSGTWNGRQSTPVQQSLRVGHARAEDFNHTEKGEIPL